MQKNRAKETPVEASQVSFCFSQRNEKRLYHEGFIFDKNRTLNNTTYWRCKSRKKHGCSATFRTQTQEKNGEAFKIILRKGEEANVSRRYILN